MGSSLSTNDEQGATRGCDHYSNRVTLVTQEHVQEREPILFPLAEKLQVSPLIAKEIGLH